MQMLLEASDDDDEEDEDVKEEEEPDKIKEARATFRDKYEALSANDIRKMCTAKDLKLKSGMKKGERVEIRVRIDLAAEFFINVVLGDGKGSKKRKVGSRTKHCMYRLLNIVFLDQLAVRFSQSGNKAPRADLDTRAINDRSNFRQDVRAAFVQEYPEEHEVNELFMTHYLFEGITPSVFKPHSAEKLFDM
ncbi:hypothetical protein GN958_ATG05800 [Phytophthora infestans]|uniref:Uncharacterized protein n=1 Tax=Phytophthora infestans TaxID=4787 RepID=A0A8S9V1B6_PHYIN|nr:hypothetical protein GN958_ATG05800 [Phytophthora infestans]